MDYYSKNNLGGCLLTILLTLGTIVLSLAFALLFAFPEMWLWNWLIPDIFNGPEVTYWQMVGLHFLCVLMFPKVSVNNNNKG